MLTKRYESIDENGGENDNCTGCRNDIPVPVSISSFARGSIVPRRDLDHLIDYTSPVSVTIQRYVSSHLSKRRFGRDLFYSYGSLASFLLVEFFLQIVPR